MSKGIVIRILELLQPPQLHVALCFRILLEALFYAKLIDEVSRARSRIRDIPLLSAIQLCLGLGSIDPVLFHASYCCMGLCNIIRCLLEVICGSLEFPPQIIGDDLLLLEPLLCARLKVFGFLGPLGL